MPKKIDKSGSKTGRSYSRSRKAKRQPSPASGLAAKLASKAKFNQLSARVDTLEKFLFGTLGPNGSSKIDRSTIGTDVEEAEEGKV